MKHEARNTKHENTKTQPTDAVQNTKTQNTKNTSWGHLTHHDLSQTLSTQIAIASWTRKSHVDREERGKGAIWLGQNLFLRRIVLSQ